jgi:hypothetical protein
VGAVSCAAAKRKGTVLYFFLPAGFLAFLPAADLVEAFFALLADFVAVVFVPLVADFLPPLPKAWSQFCQNFGVVPVRTIGPLIVAYSWKMFHQNDGAIVCKVAAHCQAPATA